MALKNDVIIYLKQKIVEAGFKINAIYEKEQVCVIIFNDKYKTPKICSKSELYTYAKAFYYVFIQRMLKKQDENS